MNNFRFCFNYFQIIEFPVLYGSRVTNVAQSPNITATENVLFNRYFARIKLIKDEKCLAVPVSTFPGPVLDQRVSIISNKDLAERGLFL